jgi:hypothetical protein
MGTRHWPDDANEEFDRLNRRIEELEADLKEEQRKYKAACDDIRTMLALNEEQEAKLNAVGKLPDRWRPRFETGDDGKRVRINRLRTGGMCANELEATLQQEGEK